jgi:hypothetical protein
VRYPKLDEVAWQRGFLHRGCLRQTCCRSYVESGHRYTECRSCVAWSGGQRTICTVTGWTNDNPKIKPSNFHSWSKLSYMHHWILQRNVYLIITEAKRIITIFRGSESVVMSTIARVCQKQTCQSLYQPVKEVQHDQCYHINCEQALVSCIV